jgi:hypothetical protein
MGGVATPSRLDDRSGLLDIRALSSMIDAQRGGASASGVALPTFGTPWALQEVKAAPTEPRASTPARTVMVGPDHRPLYVMIAALSVAVASLGAYVLMAPTPTVVVERTAVVAGVAEGEGEAEEAAKAEAEAKAKAKAEADAKAKADALLAANTADAKAEDGAEPEVRARGHRPNKPDGSSKPPKLDPKPEPKDAGVVSVECVIDPSKCDRKGKPKPVDTSNDDDGGGGEPSKALASAPSTAQIRTAMTPVKPQAKACAARHGGKAGDTVRVKLSVSGPTGKVLSAQALDDHAGTSLGKCVADALGKAELPKFGKPQAGIVYAVKL